MNEGYGYAETIGEDLEITNGTGVSIGVSDLLEYTQVSMTKRRTLNNQHTFHKELIVLHNGKGLWMDKIEETFKDFLFVCHSNQRGAFIKTSDDCFILYAVNSKTITFNVYGEHDFIDQVESMITKLFTLVVSRVRWIYTSQGHSVDIPLMTARLPDNEMYPFINEPLIDYYDNFMMSTSNILLLIGPPGTGKTSFIRGLLAHTKASATVTYDEAILKQDFVFANFVEDDTSVMVLEDSDTFLCSRSDGNDMMQRFLNIGDGLVTSANKKLIFSTNLPSVRDIDVALTRPGRCYDILHFRELTHQEASVVAAKHNIKLNTQKEKWTLAEIFNQTLLHHTAPTSRFVR